MTTLGSKLRTYRDLTGLTLKQVAHFTRISLSFLSDIERGRTNPSIATLKRLATFYKVSMDTLLMDTVSEQPQDDQAREDAISDLKAEVYNRRAGERGEAGAVSAFADVCEDYEEMRWMGDLGGCELI